MSRLKFFTLLAGLIASGVIVVTLSVLITRGIYTVRSCPDAVAAAGQTRFPVAGASVCIGMDSQGRLYGLSTGYK